MDEIYVSNFKSRYNSLQLIDHFYLTIFFSVLTFSIFRYKLFLWYGRPLP